MLQAKKNLEKIPSYKVSFHNVPLRTAYFDSLGEAINVARRSSGADVLLSHYDLQLVRFDRIDGKLTISHPTLGDFINGGTGELADLLHRADEGSHLAKRASVTETWCCKRRDVTIAVCRRMQ